MRRGLSIRDNVRIAQLDPNSIANRLNLDPRYLQGLSQQQLARLSRIRNISLARQLVSSWRAQQRQQARPQQPQRRPQQQQRQQPSSPQKQPQRARQPSWMPQPMGRQDIPRPLSRRDMPAPLTSKDIPN